VSFAGCLGWLVVVIAFGKLIGNYFDFRPLIQGIVTLALAGFSLRTALGKA
jgi:exosortase/archaeosortase